MKSPLFFLSKLSLRSRVILIIVFVQTLFISVAFFTMIQGEHKLVERSAKRTYLMYATTVADAILIHLMKNDLEWINYHLTNVTRDEGVMYVTVKDKNGEILGSKGQPAEFEKPLMEKEFFRIKENNKAKVEELDRHPGSFLHERGHNFLVTVPLEENSSFIGAVHIVFSTKELNQAVIAHGWRVLRLILSGAIIIAIVVVFVDRKLKGTIKKLINVTGKMAEGDLSQKVDIHTGDDLEKLGNSFNRMAENLLISRKKLKEWGENLEQKVAERTEEIEKEEQKLDRIVSGIGAGLALINKDFSLVWVNEYYKEKLSLKDDKILGKKCFRAFWERDSNCRDCAVLRTFESGKIERDKIVVKRENALKYYNITSTPINDEKGNVIQVLELTQDETESKKLEIQLEHASKMAALGEFAAGVAHEINNPIASVAAYAERLALILKRDALFPENESEKILSYLENIQYQAYRTKGITGSILDFVRKKEVTKVRELDINDVIEKVLKLVELQFKTQKLNLRKVLTPKLFCFTDKDQLEQVLLNLLKNAFDAVEEGGEITIKTWQDKNTVFALVKDNGQGIEPEAIQKIFDPFYTTKEPGKGTGLGLSICYGIMHGLGGNIEVNSTPGQGSTFILSIPVKNLQGDEDSYVN